MTTAFAPTHRLIADEPVFWLVRCARCGGDLYLGSDQYGRFIACVQCSHELTKEQKRALWHRPSTSVQEAA